MTQEERTTLSFNLTTLIAIYGPWAVLWETARLLKPEFKAMKEKTKRAKKKGGEG